MQATDMGVVGLETRIMRNTYHSLHVSDHDIHAVDLQW